LDRINGRFAFSLSGLVLAIPIQGSTHFLKG
jgi:hypothetical protein